MGKLERIIDGHGEMIEFPAGLWAMKKLADHIECNDGITLSVQASSFHYCSPRDNHGPYNSVEVMLNDEPPETWAQYFDGDWEDAEARSGVYGYVPVELVYEYVASHGGEK